MKLLAIGDIFGTAGRKAAVTWIPRLRREFGASFVVANVENLHAGRGADAAEVRELLASGADCLTSGNHIWSQRGHEKLLEAEGRLLRPANYPDPCPGRGVAIGITPEGARVAVINLIGRLFLGPVDDPFRVADRLLAGLHGEAEVVVIDFHAEATTEKHALASYVDGRVSAVFGTHTHVQTADARVLARGTGYITDLGMTGPYDSIIGMDRDVALARFLTSRPSPGTPADGAPGLRGALFDIDEASGRCRSVERVARGGAGA